MKVKELRALSGEELKNKLIQYADEGKWFKSLPPPKSKAA